MESVHLVGTEEVRTAGYAMERAGAKIQSSADQISHAFRDHQQFMDNWLERFEAAVRRLHATDQDAG